MPDPSLALELIRKKAQNRLVTQRVMSHLGFCLYVFCNEVSNENLYPVYPFKAIHRKN